MGLSIDKNLPLKQLIFILPFFIITACGFNKSFYHPNTDSVQTPPDAESHYIHYGENDSIHSLFFERKSPIASILILHGNAGNLTSWGEVADLFYQAGYQVMIIDYPGFGNSSGEAKHDAVFTSTQKAVEEFAARTGDTKRLLMGFSLGGNLAVKMGHDNQTLFDALLIEGAFESHKSVAKDRVPRPFKFAPAIMVKNAIKGKELIASWKKPLLIVHSEDDAVCKYEMGQTLFQHATGTMDKELWTIKGPHLAGLGQNFDLYMAKVKNLVSN